VPDDVKSELDGGDGSAPDSVAQHHQQRRTHSPGSTRRPTPRGLAPLAAVLFAVAAVVAVLAVSGPITSAPTPAPVVETGPSSSSAPGSAPGQPASAIVPAVPVDVGQLAALQEATTFTVIPNAAKDPSPQTVPNGLVVHPADKIPAYASPGGPAVAAIPPQQLGSDTWLPVVSEQPGWVQVLLPSRPNSSAAWIRVDGGITIARSPYLVLVDRSKFQLTVMREGQQVGTWTVGIGKPSAVTPAGRTFILSSIKDTKQTFSPIVIPLGAHSDTHLTFGGGPGTVGVHGWPTDDVLGQASSDGCVRVPADALQMIAADVPLGTPVVIK
jgi:L,D-transpeptidase catalytic domain